MAFNLQISAKRDPLERLNADSGPRHPAPCAVIMLNGTFSEAASREVLGAIADLIGDRTDSIIVEMQDVSSDDADCLQRFVTDLMSLRNAGRNVQLAVRDPSLHATLAGWASSRDWLLWPADVEIDGGRRGIYVDPPSVDP